MRTAVLSLAAAHLLCGAFAQEWQVAAYTGLQCNGEQLSVHEPLQQPAEDIECRTITYPERTSSLVFSISDDTDDTWVFGLHSSPNDASCIYDQDGAGSYTLQPGANNVCIQPQEGESTFHVQRSSARKIRRAQDYGVM